MAQLCGLLVAINVLLAENRGSLANANWRVLIVRWERSKPSVPASPAEMMSLFETDHGAPQPPTPYTHTHTPTRMHTHTHKHAHTHNSPCSWMMEISGEGSAVPRHSVVVFHYWVVPDTEPNSSMPPKRYQSARGVGRKKRNAKWFGLKGNSRPHFWHEIRLSTHLLVRLLRALWQSANFTRSLLLIVLCNMAGYLSDSDDVDDNFEYDGRPYRSEWAVLQRRASMTSSQ